jgi:phytoene dehydrogenase-like protein
MSKGASAWDAVVVGAGHNGLVAAAYLARAGLRTLVLERRDRVGGAAETSELMPGVRVPTLAHTVGRLSPSVVRDLDLGRHGLSLVAPDVRVFAPSADGSAVALSGSVAWTAESLRRRSQRDAKGYASFDRLVRSLGGFMAELANATPPDVGAAGLGDALAGLRLGRRYRGLGARDARTITRVLPMAIADFVAEAFETDALRAAIAWRGVRYCALGPRSAGTTAVLLADGAGNDGGAAGESVFARGGPGAVATALAAAAREAGVEIRTGTAVAAVNSTRGRATGVVLDSGDEVAARIVVSAIDPKRTLLDLVDPVALGPSLGWRAGNYRMPGVVAKVNFVLGRFPRFPAAAGEDEHLLRGRIVVAPGIDAIERAFDASKYGQSSETPILEATIPSLVDPSLVDGAPEGTHVMSVIAQYMPYHLRGGSWDDRRDEVGDLVVRVLESVSPGLGGLITQRQIITPLDLERDYGLTGGHPLHGEPGLDQFFAWRPLLGHARYRMPVEGLYLASSGAHPGGGVTGMPGRNAVREILADAKQWRGR